MRKLLNWITKALLRAFFWINIFSDIWTGYLYWSVLLELFGFVFQQVKSSKLSPLNIAYPFLSSVLIPIIFETVKGISFGIFWPIIILFLQFLAWFSCFLRSTIYNKLCSKYYYGAFSDIASIKS